jgi:asparagine synthase (glutamine-hydrolysing)
MCGILGVYNKSGIVLEQFLKQRDSISHRGPDDAGLWISDDCQIGLASRRLSIQDLSSNGRMPMVSSDSNFIIVFNGEIYNYLELKSALVDLGFSFNSNSDTECVLNAYIAWGTNCLTRLTGMFSIAVFDIKKNYLFLARDRAGEKPLYYWSHHNGFSFSSELKQLLIDNDLPRKLNFKAVKQYFEDGFAKGEVSFIDDVYKLSSGHYLIYDLNYERLEIFKYWDVPVYSNNNVIKDDLLEQLDALLSESVRKQMISDVPLGVLLSGGVDSSLITSYAVENTSDLKTFHISFDGFGKFDESAHARQVSEYFGTNHYELSGNEIEFEMIDEMLEYFDEPLGDSSMLPTFLVSKLTKEHVTVALGGDGGDELFGGYLTYATLLSDRYSLLHSSKYLSNFFDFTGSKMPAGMKGRNFLLNTRGDKYERFLNNRIFDKYSFKEIFAPDYFKELELLKSKIEIEISDDFLYDITKYDFKNYLCDDILVKVDRASMASSLELRAPFLDSHLIEFAFSQVPSYLKIGEGSLKILLKDLLKKRIPSKEFDFNRKQGFSIPLNDWIADKWHENMLQEISELPSIFNRDFIYKMCLNVKRGYSNSSRLYAIIVFSKWMKKYNILY